MTKKEFLELAKKHQEGECSEREKEILFSFCDKVQFKNLLNTWNVSEEEQTRIAVLRKIRFTVRSHKKQQKRKSNLLKIKAFALIIGLLITGYYLQYTTKTIIPTNAITLKLEDGSIAVIDEKSETNSFLNKKGNLLGVQKGKRLVYEKGKATKKVVYNTLSVPYGKRFELELSDGTTAYLNAGTSIKYPVKFLNGMERKVFITGEAYFKVTRDSAHPFIVNADKLNVKVLGTAFNVQAYPEDTVSEIVLVEGSVALYKDSKKTGNKTLLTPGFKASFNRQNSAITTKKVLTGVYTSWINGELVFRNMTFENILKKLERHYNIEILNNNSKLSKTLLNASFGNESIAVILESLKENYGIEYVISGKKITINN
ncbi:iron dicitrate transport regulator FecR [Polaribacter sp. ALD11]|uniref:FecR family protein n=1 Tax=Polaribacter sp. ALD11 TaxID=2058137 RepID=UPI000C310D11|nr:FecR family protein [Polaribacter sp. ALD11]AUC85183.1 iron dicitrate transport regulator FecR [Polaribacter sp. ALD11]